MIYIYISRHAYFNHISTDSNCPKPTSALCANRRKFGVLVPRKFFNPHCPTPGSTNTTSVPMTFVWVYPQWKIGDNINAQWHTRRCSALFKSFATSAIWRSRVGLGARSVWLFDGMSGAQVGSKAPIGNRFDLECDYSRFKELWSSHAEARVQ